MNAIDLFKRTAQRFPDKIAVDDLSHMLTFSELDALSDTIALQVHQVVGATRMPVAVVMDKSALVLAALVGVAKAGCFYVPIGEDQPDDRIASMLAVLEAPLVLTGAGRDMAHVIPGASTLAVLDESGALKSPGDTLLAASSVDVSITLPQPLASDPLYAIFTSGSTGTPKCVVISHGALVSFIEDFTDVFAITVDDTLANQAPFDFDISVKDIYSCLSTGATLVLLPRKLFSFPPMLLTAITEKRPTVCIWAVSAMIIVSQFKACEAFAEAAPTLRMIAFSGEVLPTKHFEAWRAALAGVSFVNLYGPTEITCNCAYYRVPEHPTFPLPIGRPFKHNRVFLIAEDGTVPDMGELGEICVEGPNVSLGYYHNAEQTAAAFTSNPFLPDALYRTVVYHTGDLATCDADGLFHFAGRVDNQVKYMGHRIELAEVECAFDDMPGVSRCACILNETANRLELHYTLDAGAQPLDAAAFAEHAATRLPAPMTPKHYECRDAFPLTRNGKIDRTALRRDAEGR